MEPDGRPKRRAFNTPGDSHFLTFSTDSKRPYLRDERVCLEFANGINKAAKKHRFLVLAYVFMPDHSHLLVHPTEEIYSIELMMKAIKQGVSFKAKRRGWIDTDLWERGGGYDRNVSSEKVRRETIRYIHENPIVEGLVEDILDYRWSSARWFETGERGDVECAFHPGLFDL